MSIIIFDNLLFFPQGAKDTFNVTGLSKKLSNPTRIQTTPDFDNIYVLDNGNSRIVILKKDGTFVKDYTASAIKNAIQFDVLEKDKKAFVLAGDKVYQLDLK